MNIRNSLGKCSPDFERVEKGEGIKGVEAVRNLLDPMSVTFVSEK
jgi:hypothetical protein